MTGNSREFLVPIVECAILPGNGAAQQRSLSSLKSFRLSGAALNPAGLFSLWRHDFTWRVPLPNVACTLEHLCLETDVNAVYARTACAQDRSPAYRFLHPQHLSV